MANILMHSTVPSLLTNTDSTSNLLVDTPTEASHTNNKYNGHVTRLRNVFAEHSLMANKFNSDDQTTDYRETKGIFQTLDATTPYQNDSQLTTKSMVNTNRQERSHEISKQSSLNTSTNRSFDGVPNGNEDVSYAIINRRCSNNEQHYDFPADAIQQYKKQQRDENEIKPSTEQLTTRFLPFNALKRMDHLNTVFVKPTKIDQSLPKLIFSDSKKHSLIKSNDNPTHHETDYTQVDNRSSSPIFYEKPGIPELPDEIASDEARRVKFSHAPIRVYPTYSPSEYDRRNEDIDPFAAAAEYELEKRIEKMNVFSVEVEKGPDGLGISVLGMGVGADSGLEKLGIFVKSLNPQGIIAKDGRIQVGDQIIEVNEHSLVGVTHACATNVLKTTSGLVKFLIGREKEPEKSEIFALIQRSLQLDQQREDISQTFQQYHDAYYEQNFNDEEEPMDEKLSNEFGIEILKQCYESLERTLDTTEKEREQYRQLYQQAQNDFKQIEEKYSQATALIKELQDRETESRRQQTELSEQHDKRVNQLMQKIDDLEKVIATSATRSENNLSSFKTTEFPVSHSPETSERTTFRTRSNSGQPLITTNRLPMTVSSVRIPSLSLEKMLTRSPNDIDQWQMRSATMTTKSSDQFDRSALLNKSPSTKAHTMSIPGLHVSTPSLGGISSDSNFNDARTSITKDSSADKTSTEAYSTDEYVEIKDWTTDRCIQWLTAQRMTSLIPIFLNRNIDGEKLLVLDGSKMKAMGIKSSKDRDQLKSKIKELKHVELNQLRDRLMAQSSASYRSGTSEKKSRSSSLSKLRERRFFSSSFGK
ncbi:unnamed protein product [Adineta ricciae]|uniref:Neurabin-1-like protein n=1 Tax=Adineta ricciae TaxID=249248 RepID=A0A814Q7V6_ADIRI|nr:unnamed protein product [Adineta ricciae]CAF1115572.1 unnamed protein product [Adineta ricciae]